MKEEFNMDDDGNFKLGILLGIFMLLAAASIFFVGFYFNQEDVGFSPCIEDELEIVTEGVVEEDVGQIDEGETEQVGEDESDGDVEGTEQDEVGENDDSGLDQETFDEEEEWDGFSDNDDSEDAITIDSGDGKDSDAEEWDYGDSESYGGYEDDDDDDYSESYGGERDSEERYYGGGDDENDLGEKEELLLGPERSEIGKWLKLGVWILIGAGAFAGIAIFFYKLGREKSKKRKKMLIWIAVGFVVVAGMMFFVGMYFGNSAVQFSPCIDEGSDYEDPEFNVSYADDSLLERLDESDEIVGGDVTDEVVEEEVDESEVVEDDVVEENVEEQTDIVVDDISVYYGFDDNSLSGASWTENGKIGGAYDFDGVDDYISISGLDLSEYSIAFWFKADDPLSKTQSLISRGEDWEKDVAQLIIELNDNANPGKVQLWYEEENDNDHYFATTSSIEVDRWYYFVVSRSSEGNVRVYLDGFLESERQDSESAGEVSGDTPILIGARRNAPDKVQDYFDGVIDELRIYDRVLSDEEIGVEILDGDTVPEDSIAIAVSEGSKIKIGYETSDFYKIYDIALNGALIGNYTFSVNEERDTAYLKKEGVEMASVNYVWTDKINVTDHKRFDFSGYLSIDVGRVSGSSNLYNLGNKLFDGVRVLGLE